MHKKNHKTSSGSDKGHSVHDKKTGSVKKILLKLKYYIFEDESPMGWLIAFVAMFLFLKFLLIPLISFGLHTGYPIVAVISGSMEHRLDNTKTVCGVSPIVYNGNFDNWWNTCGSYYQKNYNFTEDEFSKFPQKNGFNIGDVMILYGTAPKKLKLGDIIVFDGGRSKPIIHRIVKIRYVDGVYYFTTKGDHNPESYPEFEWNIPQDKYIGKAVFKIPYIGYVKIFVVNAIDSFVGLFKR